MIQVLWLRNQLHAVKNSESKMLYKWQEFVNQTNHIAVICPTCGKVRGYAYQEKP